MKFYDRENELDALERIYARVGADLVIVSGRRRIGKSRLIDEFARGKSVVSTLIVPKEERQVAKDIEDATRLATGYSPPMTSIRDAFEYLLEREVPLIILDEFPNILAVNESIPYELQRLWDKNREARKSKLIVSGSYAGMMNRLFAAKKAPLFNRASMTLDLQQLRLGTAVEILNDLGVRSPQEQVGLYCVFGGVPYYYVLLEKLERRTLSGAVGSLFFDVGAQLRDEGENVLRQEFGNAYPKYYAILEAISAGHASMNEISQSVGIRSTTLSKYMKALQHDFKLVDRMVPHGEKPSRSKKGLYSIRDNTLAFWFSHVYGKLSTPTDGELSSFVSKRFEGLCRDFLTEYVTSLGERPLTAGRWWGPVRIDGGRYEQREIDVVVETNKALYLGECKWTEAKAGGGEMAKLRESSKAIETKKPLKLVLFSKRGFDTEGNEDALLFDAESMVRRIRIATRFK